MYTPDEFNRKSESKYRTNVSAEKYRDIEWCVHKCAIFIEVRFARVTVCDSHCD